MLWQVLCCVAGMGMVEDGDGVLVTSHFAGAVSSGRGVWPCFCILCETDSGNTQFLCWICCTLLPCGTETESGGAQFHVAAASSAAIETDLENARFDGAAD